MINKKPLDSISKQRRLCSDDQLLMELDLPPVNEGPSVVDVLAENAGVLGDTLKLPNWALTDRCEPDARPERHEPHWSYQPKGLLQRMPDYEFVIDISEEFATTLVKRGAGDEGRSESGDGESGLHGQRDGRSSEAPKRSS